MHIKINKQNKCMCDKDEGPRNLKLALEYSVCCKQLILKGYCLLLCNLPREWRFLS